MIRQDCLIGENECFSPSRVNESLAQYEGFIQHTQKAFFNILKGILFIAFLSVAVLPLFALVLLAKESEFNDRESELS